MKLKQASTLAVTLVFAAALAAQQTPAQSPKAPPTPAPPKPFRVPAKTEFRLANGARVTLVPYGSVPKARISVIVRAGALNEGAKQVWLSRLTGEMLREGTRAKAAEVVDREAARMGGAIEVDVGADQTRISADVLGEFAPKMASLLAEVVTSPRLPQSELPRLRNDAVRQLAIAKSQPHQLAAERFLQLLYPNHPYGRMFPTQEMLAAYTLADVRNFYQENYGAARTHVYVIGKFDVPAVRAAIQKAFGSWNRGRAPLIAPPKPSSGHTLEVVPRPGAVQSTLYVGLPTIDPSHPDYVPLVVTDALLGGSYISRITTNIRENKGYTYSPHSMISARYRDAYWAEVADVTTAVTGASLKEIYGEIERLRNEPPSKEELGAIQRSLAGGFVIRNSRRTGLQTILNFVDLHGLGDEYLSSFVQRVYAVTPADVQRIARKYIDPQRITLVVVGDQPKIADQIAPYRPGS